MTAGRSSRTAGRGSRDGSSRGPTWTGRASCEWGMLWCDDAPEGTGGRWRQLSSGSQQNENSLEILN